MQLDASAASDTGRVRAKNEDNLFRGATAFAVADGLGGHQAGEVAAALALGPVADLDRQAFKGVDDARTALADAVREANRVVYEAARADPTRRGMGTTLTAAVAVGEQLVLAHVGDSRAYLLRPAEPFRQLTTDHTAVAELVRRGNLTAGQAAIHPARSVLLQAVGLEPSVRVETPPVVRLRAGDQVLLCSDGLTEALGDDVISQTLAEAADGETACRALIDAANNAGGPDNVTVVLLRARD